MMYIIKLNPRIDPRIMTAKLHRLRLESVWLSVIQNVRDCAGEDPEYGDGSPLAIIVNNRTVLSLFWKDG
jgi:hypothetical protein